MALAPGYTPGNPEEPRARPGGGAPQPPQARPGWPGLREPSPRPAPALTAHARPPPSPGAGTPAAAACPRGRARRGDRVPGSGRALGAAEDTAGGRRHASSPAASAAHPEPEESLAERGVAPRGRRGRVPALPRPAPGVRPFPRESAPHRLGAEQCAGGAPADAIVPGLVPRSLAGLEEETAPT